MPLAWIHALPKEDAEKLAMELGVSVQGTLDELRKRLKEKWRLLQIYLPPQSTDKSGVAVHTAASSSIQGQGGNVHDHDSYFRMKLKGNVVTGLVKNIPVLSSTEPEAVFQFLVRASEIHRLNLVPDEELLALLVARTTGRITQIFGVHLSVSSCWTSVCSEILSIFLPPRIREGFVSKYILDRFQSATEELSQFVMSVVSAVDVLGYKVPESDLVHRVVQNIHPSVRSRLVFASEPKSISDLYFLASQVAEGRAIDDRRRELERYAPSGNRQSDRSDSRHVSMTVGETRRSSSRVLRCFNCSGIGHARRNCPSSVTSSTRNQGNESGARQ
jgi:hypothetical protein